MAIRPELLIINQPNDLVDCAPTSSPTVNGQDGKPIEVKLLNWKGTAYLYVWLIQGYIDEEIPYKLKYKGRNIMVVLSNANDYSVKLSDLSIENQTNGNEMGVSIADLPTAFRMVFGIYDVSICQTGNPVPVIPHVCSRVIQMPQTFKIMEINKTTSCVSGNERLMFHVSGLTAEDKEVIVCFRGTDEDGEHASSSRWWEDVYARGYDVDKCLVKVYTPPYKEQLITERVKVFVYLQSHNTTQIKQSEALEFFYIPYDRDPYQIQKKRRKMVPQEFSNFPPENALRDIKTIYRNNNTPDSSQQTHNHDELFGCAPYMQQGSSEVISSQRPSLDAVDRFESAYKRDDKPSGRGEKCLPDQQQNLARISTVQGQLPQEAFADVEAAEVIHEERLVGNGTAIFNDVNLNEAASFSD